VDNVNGPAEVESGRSAPLRLLDAVRVLDLSGGSSGENADGYGAKENTGAGNVFRGCRSWDNADDGWDFYGWSSPITVDNCWAINQTATIHGSNSDGNGFKPLQPGLPIGQARGYYIGKEIIDLFLHQSREKFVIHCGESLRVFD